MNLYGCSQNVAFEFLDALYYKDSELPGQSYEDYL